ncbi:MAG: exonuclease domain-containing protein [Candidatus Peribacteraceae bacterium]|nr:exonuclease domain-containing protein [Candidatus Peribacteraceae bacterium]
MPLPSFPFTVLDTETTGFVPKANRVIEFASIRIEGGKNVDEYETLISIPEEIPPPVQVLTHIRPDMLAGKPVMETLRETILEHIGPKTLIVGQNVGFDLRMLKGEGIDLSERPWIDTSMLASLVYPELLSYSLGYVSSVLTLNHNPVHRALGDVHATLELLEKCWERLLGLPEKQLAIVREAFARSAPGYQMLAAALPQKSTAKKLPAWFSGPRKRAPGSLAISAGLSAALAVPRKGEPALVEETLDPSSLPSIVETAIEDRSTTHWIAVKNLESALRRLSFPEDEVRVIYPPFLLLDPKAQERFLAQESWTADEATLAIKLHWFSPKVQRQIALHGEERSIWYGKLACTRESPAYRSQFEKIPGVVLIDHQQLLEILGDGEHFARPTITAKAHIILDDASMLEDTATKAYRWQTTLDHLRAASEGHEALTRFTDLLQLWIERVRAFQDVRYLTAADIESREAEALRERMPLLRKEKELSFLVQDQLADLDKILTPELLSHRIAWIEQRQNGSQYLQSVPEHVGPILAATLFAEFPTTLLIPAGSAGNLREVLPSLQLKSSSPFPRVPLNLSIDTATPLPVLLKDPPKGKTVVLVGSRRLIEDAYVHHAERLEGEGITMVCQNLSGGLERLTAEFLAAEAPALWLLTPWSYEEVEMPAGTVDHLVIASLPFDHPSHTVLSRRSEHYTDSFSQYFLPRLEHRLFRLVRTFCRHKKKDGDIRVTDERLISKKYGRQVREYLEGFSAKGEEVDAKPQMGLFGAV